MGNPIRYIDPTGRKIEFLPGTTEEYKNDYYISTSYLREHGASNYIDFIEKSDKIYYIGYGNFNSSRFDASTNTIYWRNDYAIITNNSYILSASEILNHEAAHATRYEMEPNATLEDNQKYDEQFGNAEERRVITGPETETAIKLGELNEGETTRDDHGGTEYQINNPISHDWDDLKIIECVAPINSIFK